MGGDLVTTYRHGRVRGKWLLTEFTMLAPSETISYTRRWTFTYNWDQGVPLLAKVHIVTDAVSPAFRGQSYHEFAFRDWEVVKRESPIEILPGSGAPGRD